MDISLLKPGTYSLDGHIYKVLLPTNRKRTVCEQQRKRENKHVDIIILVSSSTARKKSALIYRSN